MKTWRIIVALVLVSFLCSCQKADPKDIHAAARQGSETRVAQALDLGVDINQKAEGQTALYQAVMAGRPKMVAFLLKKGADPNIADDKGQTPWQALWAQNRTFLTGPQGDCAVALLEGGVKPGEIEGTTYLHKAARMVNNARLIALLVDSGQDPNARDEYGWTPLHCAANRPNPDNVQALLSAKADPNAESTKTWEQIDSRGEGHITKFRYEAGSRPLDVAQYGAGRGKTAQAILQEWGGESNPKVKNIKGR